MGGHGGLNILPQKRWNVYNYDNREKVRRDEEAAEKEEQLKREQAVKRDAEFRFEKLRQARGLSKPSTSKPEVVVEREAEPDQPRESDSKHMNLFEGIRIFDPVVEIRDESKEKRNHNNNKRVKKEEPVRVVTAEDEKYRLGYGVAGKGVKSPWYMTKPARDEEKIEADDDYYNVEVEFGKRKNHSGDDGKKKQKKSLEELREERLKREQKERERERALKGEKPRRRDGWRR